MPTRRRLLLYFFYSATKNKIGNQPGIKSKICRALNYSSDGHFYYDFNRLIESGMLEENEYIRVTDKGKRRLGPYLYLSRISLTTIFMGVTLIYYWLAVKLGILMEEGIVAIGCILIGVGLFIYFTHKKYEPQLPAKARELLVKLEEA